VADRVAREFVIRLTGLPADASGPVWKFDPPGGWAGGEVYAGDQPVPDLRGISASLPKSASTVKVKVGIGMGAWEMVARQVPGGSSMTDISRQGSNWVVSFPKAENSEGGARILVTHTVKDWETRVLAVDKDGKEHPAPSSESRGTDAFTQITAKFPGLPLEQVKEFQFQVRPYQWVEFRDVTLYPKQPLAGTNATTFGPAVERIIATPDAAHPKSGVPIDDAKLRSLKWGPPGSSGLRAACYFEPTKEAYADGEVVKRWQVFHNSGKEPLFFTVTHGGSPAEWIVLDEQDREVPLDRVTAYGKLVLETFRLEPGHAKEFEQSFTGMGISTKAVGRADSAIQH